MQRNYDAALRALLIHEGGYSNHPNDPGGPTNFGITLADYRKYINKSGTAADVQGMTVEQAKKIYLERYAKRIRFDDLPDGVDNCTFDYEVNSGVRGSRVLQRTVNVPDDGEIGPQSIAAARARDPRVVVNAMCDERMVFLRSLKTWPDFGRGWTTRVREVRELSLKMAEQYTAVIAQVPTPIVAASVEPPWMQRLNAIMGLYEFPGSKNNPAILAMAAACGGNIAKTYKHDSIPWCALNENYILISSGFKGNDSLWALDFRKYGKKLSGPCYGAIATRTRDSGGHVCNVVGRTSDGGLVLRGGNQSDMVNDVVESPNRDWRFNWPEWKEPNAVGFSSLPIVKPMPKVKKEFATLPPVTAGAGHVKAEPAKPSITKPAGGTGAVGWSVTAFISEHHALAVAMGVATVFVMGGVAYVIYRNYQSKRDTPMPLVPVAA